MSNYQFFANKDVSAVGKLISDIMHRKLLIEFLKHLPEGQKTIAEIGPGRGDFAKRVHGIQQIDYVCFEPEPNMGAALEKSGLTVRKVLVPPLPDPDNTYDAIIMLNVLEHMKGTAEAQTITAEIFRALKPGGIALISFPNILDWRDDFYHLDYTHSFPTTEINVGQLLRDAGFALERILYRNGCFFSDFGRVANFLTKTARAIFVALSPRKIGRQEKIQKMGMLFAEIDTFIARKPQTL